MKYCITVLFILLSSFAFAQNTTVDRTKHLNLENGIAIQGYDPVAYFVNKALKGEKQYKANYNGAIYFFSSELNKNNFLKNPSKYEPKYGGWCAFAMGDNGKKVEIDPETFKIIDGSLYLFYNAFFNNTLKSWNKDEKNLKANAEKNWSNIIK